MATPEPSARKNREETKARMDVAIHRRILNFLNEAVQPEDLVFEKLWLPNPEIEPIHELNPDEPRLKRQKILDPEIAKEIVAFRDREFPLGFRNVNELLGLKAFDRRHLSKPSSTRSTRKAREGRS
jgi:hypothetical protein